MTEHIILEYLREMEKRNASDLYLTVGRPPTLRVDDDLIEIREELLDLDEVQGLINSVLSTRQKREFERTMELNTALDMGEHGRFRINIMRQRQTPALVIRRIISRIPTFEELGLPDILSALAMEKRGLILVSGMAGSGKSTTLASMVNHRNEREAGHIVTIEDPIEYYHEHKKSVVSQREVGVDTESFSIALKNALRQRPDVILVGEIRDAEVMQQALIAAETGHLCLATIHTSNAYQAIERIVNLFPKEAQAQVRLNLSLNLKAIVAQRLLHSKQGGLTPAVEVMLNQALVRELIMKGEVSKIETVMMQNNAIGMCTFDQALLKLFLEGRIDENTLISNADKPSDMKVKLQEVKITGRSGDIDHILSSFDTSLLSLKD